MRYIRFPLGLDAFASKPCIPIPVAAALVSAGAGLLGSGVSAASQNAANKNYLKGVRETNEANRQLFERSVEVNRQNFAMENSVDALKTAYNSPINQLARYRAAGINGIPEMMTNSPTQTISSSSPSPAVAPEQTPNPFANMNLGGIAKDSVAAYQVGQNITDMSMSLYQHGIDSAFYYEKSLNELNAQILDLAHKENLNETDRVNLSRLIFDRDNMKEEYEKHMRQVDDLHNESLAKQDLLDAQVTDIVKRYDLDKFIAKNQALHMSTQDAISRFVANTNASVATANIKRIASEVKNLAADTKLKRSQRSAQDIENSWSAYFNSLEADERRAAMYGLSLEIERSSQKNRSFLGKCFRVVFGTDIDTVLGGAASALGGYLGARAGRRR